jgi:hypothetical protein
LHTAVPVRCMCGCGAEGDEAPGKANNASTAERSYNMPVSRQDVLLKEFDWFAIDSAGELATCSSAGWGEIPGIVLQQCAHADSPMEYIDRLIAVMPEIGGHRVEGHGSGTCREWPLFGNRGLYVYDWEHRSETYERDRRPHCTGAGEHLVLGNTRVVEGGYPRPVHVRQLSVVSECGPRLAGLRDTAFSAISFKRGRYKIYRLRSAFLARSPMCLST